MGALGDDMFLSKETFSGYMFNFQGCICTLLHSVQYINILYTGALNIYMYIYIYDYIY